MFMETPRILLADNDAALRLIVRHALERANYRVDMVRDGRAAVAAAQDTPYDLLLLDVALPDRDGLEVCRRVRERSKVPIMLFAGHASEAEVVAGLNAGADDYVRKPSADDHARKPQGMAEVIARIGAVLRRVRLDGLPPASEASIRTGQLVVDIIRQSATLAGQPVLLTTLEGRLLAYLARHMDRIVPSREIIEQVWEPTFTNDTAMMWTAVSRLRGKIEPDPTHPTYIHTNGKKGGYFLAQLPDE